MNLSVQRRVRAVGMISNAEALLRAAANELEVDSVDLNVYSDNTMAGPDRNVSMKDYIGLWIHSEDRIIANGNTVLSTFDKLRQKSLLFKKF